MAAERAPDIIVSRRESQKGVGILETNGRSQESRHSRFPRLVQQPLLLVGRGRLQMAVRVDQSEASRHDLVPSVFPIVGALRRSLS